MLWRCHVWAGVESRVGDAEEESKGEDGSVGAFEKEFLEEGHLFKDILLHCHVNIFKSIDNINLGQN